MEKAREMRHKALQDENKTRATKELDAAGKRFEAAMKKLESLAKRNTEDQKLAALMERTYDEALHEAVGCYIDAGNILIFRQAFTTAMEFADKALAIDPENSTAQAFKARVQVASAAASGEGKFGGRRRR
jgi:tetratricopeptide (TPR) repeat protein